jgi:lincosamide nucleotidyltransferase B/F
MDHKQRLLDRLAAIGQSLKNSGDGLALLGLGSVGVETARLDEYSDLDFFVIVKNGCKRRFIDNLDWLTSIQPVAYYFQNTVDGYKLLYDDGIYCEFAVFEREELSAIPFAGGQIIWQDDSFDASVCTPRNRSQPEAQPVEWMLGEALTNLYVGLCRYHRSEKLSAASFIQTYAIHQIINLAPHIYAEEASHKDRFDSERRFEQRFPAIAAHLSEFMQGYERGPESALAILAFL